MIPILQAAAAGEDNPGQAADAPEEEGLAAAQDRSAPRHPLPHSPPITARKRPLGRPDSDAAMGEAGGRSAAGAPQPSGGLQPIRAAVKGVTPHGGGRWRPQLYLRVAREQVNLGELSWLVCQG